MAWPTKEQLKTVSLDVAQYAGTTGSILALIGVFSPEQAAQFIAYVHAIIADITQLVGDSWKFALFIIPIATLWASKVNWNRSSPKSLVAATQALPEAQVTVTDPKLASPGVKVEKGTS